MPYVYFTRWCVFNCHGLRVIGLVPLQRCNKSILDGLFVESPLTMYKGPPQLACEVFNNLFTLNARECPPIVRSST